MKNKGRGEGEREKGKGEGENLTLWRSLVSFIKVVSRKNSHRHFLVSMFTCIFSQTKFPYLESKEMESEGDIF